MKKLIIALLFILSVSIILCFNFACDKEQHEHVFSETWSYDNLYHWHSALCEHDSIISDKSGHDFEEKIIEPTCTENGYTICSCKICGYSYEYNIIDAIGHDYSEEIVPPTCTEKGYSIYTCSNCGDSYIDNEIDATGHDYREEIVSPTCTEKGYTIHKCKLCGDVYTDSETNVIPHQPSKEIFLNKNGHYHKCTLCGGNLEIQEHSYIYVGNKNGKHSEICSVCNYEKKNSLENCHGTEPTCKERAVCELCGEEFGNFARHNFIDNVCIWCEKSINDFETKYRYQYECNGEITSYLFKDDGYVCFDNNHKKEFLWKIENKKVVLYENDIKQMFFNIGLDNFNLSIVDENINKYLYVYVSEEYGIKTEYSFLEDKSLIIKKYLTSHLLEIKRTKWQYEGTDKIAIYLNSHYIKFSIDNYLNLSPVEDKVVIFTEVFNSYFNDKYSTFSLNFFENLSCIVNIYENDKFITTFLIDYSYLLEDIIFFDLINCTYYKKIKSDKTLVDFDFNLLTKLYEYKNENEKLVFYLEENICVLYSILNNNPFIENVGKWEINEKEIVILNFYNQLSNIDYRKGYFKVNSLNELTYLDKNNVLYYSCNILKLKDATQESFKQELFAYEDGLFEILETYQNEQISLKGTWEYSSESVISVSIASTQKNFEIIDGFYLNDYNKTNKKIVYSICIESLQKEYNFYDDGICVEIVGFNDKEGLWHDYENYIFAIFGKEQQFFIKNNDGTLTLIENSEKFYRINIYNLDKKLIDTIDFTFSENNLFSTEYTLNVASYIAVFISFDQKNYQLAISYFEPLNIGTYKIEVNNNNNTLLLNVRDVSLYYIDYFGAINLYENGSCKFYSDDEGLGENKEITTTYKINDGIYCFDLSKTKYGNIYAIKNNDLENKLDYYNPNCDIVCIYKDMDNILMFYENNFIVARLGSAILTFIYSIKEQNSNLIISASDFILGILNGNNVINFSDINHWQMGGTI